MRFDSVFPHQSELRVRYFPVCGMPSYSSFQGSVLALKGAVATSHGEISAGGFYSPTAFLFEVFAL